MAVTKVIRDKVLQERNYRCQDCGTFSQSLEVHHINSTLGDNYDNLRILCRRCHKKEHSRLYRSKNKIEGRPKTLLWIYLKPEDLLEVKIEAVREGKSFSVYISNLIEQVLNERRKTKLCQD